MSFLKSKLTKYCQESWFSLFLVKAEGRDDGEMQTHSLGLQESRPWLLQRSWTSPMWNFLMGRRDQEIWLIFKDHLLQTQESSIPVEDDHKIL